MRARSIAMSVVFWAISILLGSVAFAEAPMIRGWCAESADCPGYADSTVTSCFAPTCLVFSYETETYGRCVYPAASTDSCTDRPAAVSRIASLFADAREETREGPMRFRTWREMHPCLGRPETEASCDSTYAVDGVHCYSRCGDGDVHDCVACSVAMGGAIDGVCTPLINIDGPRACAVDPEPICGVSGSGVCGRSGLEDDDTTARIFRGRCIYQPQPATHVCGGFSICERPSYCDGTHLLGCPEAEHIDGCCAETSDCPAVDDACMEAYCNLTSNRCEPRTTCALDAGVSMDAAVIVERDATVVPRTAFHGGGGAKCAIGIASKSNDFNMLWVLAPLFAVLTLRGLRRRR